MELCKTNKDMEFFLATFRDPSTGFFTLEKPFQKEFNKPYYTTTIVLCTKEMNTLRLTLRNMTEQSSTAVALSPYISQENPP